MSFVNKRNQGESGGGDPLIVVESCCVGEVLNCLQGDDLLASRSESDHHFSAYRVSAYRLLEAIAGRYLPVLNFKMRGVISELTSRTFCRVIPSLAFCDGLVWSVSSNDIQNCFNS